LPDDSYLFLFAFDAYSSIERKNPAATIRAFQAAFPSGSERAGLVFKTRNTGTVSEASDPMQWQTVVRAAAADKRIRIIDETYSDERMRALVNCCDCYVSLHRSEGFGYGPAEAMLDGKPVIVTAYSGVTDFCTDTTAFPIPFQLAPTPYGAYPFMNRTREYVWADADTAAASAVMRMLFEHPEKGRSVGERARAFMRKRYSLSALAGRYRSRLQALGFYPNRLQMATSESH
jgi:glycosyltransferase involved in cell wall biosynthesis